MKMVIVKTEKKSAIALRDDGTFIKIPQRGYSVGQAVESSSAPKSFMRFSRAAIAAAIAIVLISSSGAMAAFLPYSYVTIDVNPSVKYTLNAFDRVLSVDAVNDDAKAIVEALNEKEISYQRIDDIIELTIKQCRFSGYVYESAEDYVVLSVMSVSSGKTVKLADKLGGSHFGGGFVSAKIVPSTISNMKQAAQKGTTPGKLMLISEMQEKTGDSKPAEDWICVPVRDIMNAAKGKQCGKPDGKKTQAEKSGQNASKETDSSLAEVSTTTDTASPTGTEAFDNTYASVPAQNKTSEQLQKASQKGDNSAINNNSQEVASDASSGKESPPGQDDKQQGQDTSQGQGSQQGQDTPPGQDKQQGQDTPPGQDNPQGQDTPPGQEATEQKEPSSASSEENSGKAPEEPKPDTFSSDDSKESGEQQANGASKN